MATTSEEFMNSTLHFLPSLTFDYCLKGKYFGLIFCYLIMTLCFLFGTPAHLWCLWLYFYTEHKRKETRVFFLNYTVMEIIYCLQNGVEMLNMIIFNSYIFWCVISFIFGLCWTGRALLQTCICIEQYMAVIHPVTFLRCKSVNYRIAAAVAAWMMAFAYGQYKVYTNYFPDYFYTFVFVIALAVISFCCVSVLCALKHPGPGNQTGRDRLNQQKRNAFNIIFSALLLIIFTYLPQTLLIIFLGTESDWTLFKCNITLSLTALNNVGVLIMPLVKIYKEGKFKRC